MSGLTFCEPVWATTRSYEHVREFDGERKTGGGVKSAALCGFDLVGGWDIEGDVTAESVRHRLGAEVNPTCPVCASLALALLHDGADA